MNRIRRIAGVLAGLACACLGLAAAAPAAFATIPVPGPPGGGSEGVAPAPAATRIVMTASMPGWQIAMIAIGAALLATAAMLVDRAWAARRKTITSAA